MREGKIERKKKHSLGDSSSGVSVTGGVVTVDDDWWCEWWFLWCDRIRCDWWWCEWECALFDELVELVEGCGGGGNPCDFVIVNSPFDVVNLKYRSISQSIFILLSNYGTFVVLFFWQIVLIISMQFHLIGFKLIFQFGEHSFSNYEKKNTIFILWKTDFSRDKSDFFLSKDNWIK